MGQFTHVASHDQHSMQIISQAHCDPIEMNVLERTDAVRIAMKVLIVEDQGLVRAGMKAMLHLTDPTCSISEAESYEQAIQMLNNLSFDIVFLDIELRSSMSGMDILHYIKQRSMPTRVIMLSADDARETVLACIDAGATGYITKSARDETVFARALSVVFQDGVYLPASVVGNHSQMTQNIWRSSSTMASDLGLAPRLCEALYYLCQGMPNKSIARQMGISEGTVRKNYVSELLRYFNVVRRTELIIEVAKRGVKVPRPDEQ